MTSQRDQAYQAGFEAGRASIRKTLAEAMKEGQALTFLLFQQIMRQCAESPDPVARLCEAFLIKKVEKEGEQ